MESNKPLEVSNVFWSFYVPLLREELIGSYIQKLQFLGNDFFRLKINLKGKGTNEVWILPQLLFVSGFKAEAQVDEKPGFVNFFNSLISNERILSIEQLNFDRVIQIQTQHYFLIFEFFSDFNFILTNETKKILGVLKPHEWKDRKLKRNEMYQPPQSKQNILQISEKDFVALMPTQTKKSFNALMELFNIPAFLLEEVFFETGLNKTIPANEIPSADWKRLWKELQALENTRRAFAPCVIETPKALEISPFPVNLFPEIEKITDLNGFFNHYFSQQLQTETQTMAANPSRFKLDKTLKSLHEILETKKRFESEALQSQQLGEFVYAHFNELQWLQELIKNGLKQKKSSEEIWKELIKSQHSNSLLQKLKEIDPKGKKFWLETN